MPKFVRASKVGSYANWVVFNAATEPTLRDDTELRQKALVPLVFFIRVPDFLKMVVFEFVTSLMLVVSGFSE